MVYLWTSFGISRRREAAFKKAACPILIQNSSGLTEIMGLSSEKFEAVD